MTEWFKVPILKIGRSYMICGGSNPPSSKNTKRMANITQLGRVLDCGSRSRGFKSHCSPYRNKACSLIGKTYHS